MQLCVNTTRAAENYTAPPPTGHRAPPCSSSCPRETPQLYKIRRASRIRGTYRLHISTKRCTLACRASPRLAATTAVPPNCSSKRH